MSGCNCTTSHVEEQKRDKMKGSMHIPCRRMCEYCSISRVGIGTCATTSEYMYFRYTRLLYKNAGSIYSDEAIRSGGNAQRHIHDGES